MNRILPALLVLAACAGEAPVSAPPMDATAALAPLRAAAPGDAVIVAAGDIADWVQRASELTVAEGDFFGSGQRLPEGHQSVLVEHEWLSSVDAHDEAALLGGN